MESSPPTQATHPVLFLPQTLAPIRCHSGQEPIFSPIGDFAPWFTALSNARDSQAQPEVLFI